MSNEDVADRTKLCQVTVKIIRDNCLLYVLLTPAVNLGRRQFQRFVVSLLVVFLLLSVLLWIFYYVLWLALLLQYAFFFQMHTCFTATSQRYNLAVFFHCTCTMLYVHKWFPSLISESELWADVFWCSIPGCIHSQHAWNPKV